MKSLPSILAALSLALAVAACGDPTKADLVSKARGADTRAKLEAALGKPTDLSKMGPVEKWTYKAKDGEVIFVITGDSVAVQAAN
jgi:hypothetical protein